MTFQNGKGFLVARMRTEDVIERMKAGEFPDADGLVPLLNARGEDAVSLAQAADAVRASRMGEVVHLRGIIEFSNVCRNNCLYCGIRCANAKVVRYRIPQEEIVEAARRATEWGCGTIVLQSGEDLWYTVDRLCSLVAAVKAATGAAITLSAGVRPRTELAALRRAGVDRYLLRFETSDRALFARLHPDATFEERIRCLENLREEGYQVGSGFMIGLPSATAADIARDLLFAQDLYLDMIGCGPFLAHPDTPLAGAECLPDKTEYYNTIALLRLMNPSAHIPATTAFDALDAGGRTRVLAGGANVFMPNVTPEKYREMYLLYPNKPCVDKEGRACVADIRARLQALGRPAGTGRGDASRFCGGFENRGVR